MIFQFSLSCRNAALAIVAMLASAAPALAKDYAFNGSRIVISLPEGFSAGATAIDNGTTEQVFIGRDFPPAAFTTLTAEMSEQRFRQHGAREVSVSKVESKNQNVLYRAVVPTGEEDFVQHVLLMNDGSFTAFVMSIVPKRRLDRGEVKETDILAALGGIKVAADFRDIFALTAPGPFKEALYSGRNELFTLDGREPASMDRPFTALELSEMAPLPAGPDLKAEAAALMSLARGLEPQSVDEVTARTVGGLDGIEVIGSAKLGGSGDEMLVYQLYLRGKKGNYRLLFRAPKAEGSAMLAEVKAIAGSLVVNE